MKKVFPILVAAALFAGNAAAQVTVDMYALNTTGTGPKIGSIEVEDTPGGALFTPDLSGLSPGAHGFHIHQNPDCGPGMKNGVIIPGLAAGGHYDPANTGRHEGPDGNGHLGDLPVLEVDATGRATAPLVASRVKVKDLAGRSLMIHAGGDNYSDVPAPLGGGGPRFACGVINAADLIIGGENEVVEDALAAQGRAILSSVTGAVGARFRSAGVVDEAGAPAWSLWGVGDIQSFEGSPGESDYDGEWKAVYLGVDAQLNENWLAGVSVSRGWGKTDYEFMDSYASGHGELETDLTALYPYLHGRFNGGLELWGIAGGGWGDVEISRDYLGAVEEENDLTLWLGALGVKLPFRQLGSMQLSLVGDAGFVHLSTDEKDDLRTLNDLEVETQRVRLGLEGEHGAADGAALHPFWRLSGQYDGGDGQDGTGLEAIFGLRYGGERLSVEARGRWLGLHSASGYEEYGGSLTARVSPRSDGTGLSLSLAPRWGASGDGRKHTLLGNNTLYQGERGAGLRQAGPGWSVDGELGYGIRFPHFRGLLTPFSEFDLSGASNRQLRLGLRFDLAPSYTGIFRLELSGGRHKHGLEQVDHRVQLTGEARF